MGVDRQRTTRIRQTQKKTYNGTSHGPLQAQGTNQDRNRRVQIRLLRHPITIMRRWKMETGSLSIKDHARRRMQRWHTGQGTIGDSPSLKGMEKVHERKSETSTSLHRSQKPDHFYVNKRTQRLTRKMARIPQPIQFQNHIPTRKGGKEAWRSHQKTRRYTHTRRKETRKEKRNPTIKREILGHTRKRRYQAGRNRASRISGQGRRKNPTSIHQRRRNPSHQEELVKQR